MGVSRSSPEKGISVVTVDFPPVNALPVRGWSELAAAVRESGRDADVRCVVLAAEGRGFNAGVDIKEIQAAGREALIGANHGCAEAFAAVYECAVPVVAAVQGFCLGGGIGLVGNADAIVASEDAAFGLPELDRGALGAATHLARLVPQHLMRALYYTGRTASAAELHRHGSVWRVVPRPELREAALALAREIAAKDGRLLRMAKAAINGIDPVDVRRSYRFEQGFTFEANLSGLADRVRDTFGTADGGGDAEGSRGGADGRSGAAGGGEAADRGGGGGKRGAAGNGGTADASGAASRGGADVRDGAARSDGTAGDGGASAESETSGKEGA